MIIGLDVGGTHTDVVLLGKTGPLKEIKVPTDSSDLFHTVLTGLSRITEGISLDKIQRLVLSTTLTTNCIAQKKMLGVGMIVVAGPGIDPEYFRTNPHYAAVSGAMDHRGREIAPLSPREILRVADQFRSAGIRQVGVVSKFSVRNPAHELAIESLLKDRFEKIFIGHHVSGCLNFPRRIATTFLNVSAYPIHKTFYEAVRKSLVEKGLNLPLRILKADGGNMRFDTSIDHPAQTILSGPAASVMGAIAFAPRSGETLVLDIGGTTTDMAVLIDAVPLLDPVGIEIGGYKTLIRSLRTCSIALGGDSEVRVEGGTVVIGPERRGVAMAFGGPAPTPTDAFVVLGMLKEGDKQSATAGIEPVSQALDLSVEAAAEAIISEMCRKIMAAAGDMIDQINAKPVYTVHELWEGKKVEPKHILILGGPAPLFAEKLGAISQCRTRVVPRWTVANAVGAALARTTCDIMLFADTQQGVVTAPVENFYQDVTSAFNLNEAKETALMLLREKAVRQGANLEFLETEIIEAQEFNMVRGFRTMGKNIRIRAQVKPGLIHGYEEMLETMDGAAKFEVNAITPFIEKPWKPCTKI